MHAVHLALLNVRNTIEPLEQRREKLLAMIADAGKSGAQIVLLPEFADHHRTPEALDSIGRGGREYIRTCGMRSDHKWLASVADLSRQFNMVTIPVVMLVDETGVSDTALVFGPSGSVIGRYDKTHLAPGSEKLWFIPGKSINVIETPYARLGICICYDFHFPEISRVQELGGAQLLFWSTMRWDNQEPGLYNYLLPARAIQHGMPLAVATYVTDEQRAQRSVLSSTIFNPFGQVLAGGHTEPGVVAAKVDLDARPLMPREYGSSEHYDYSSYMRRQRRPELYASIARPLTDDERDVAKEPVVHRRK
ncbi:MAG TPA: carbon-nitrogen hydrolase family protein [Planctomycetota bacterium]|nr:carbon-nitrogen hydrolase family protein [Planctomycetota bacterium]